MPMSEGKKVFFFHFTRPSDGYFPDIGSPVSAFLRERKKYFFPYFLRIPLNIHKCEKHRSLKYITNGDKIVATALSPSLAARLWFSKHTVNSFGAQPETNQVLDRLATSISYVKK